MWLATIPMVMASVLLGINGDMDPRLTSEHTTTTASTEAHIILLDDMDPSLMSKMANAYEGSYTPCMVDAYNQQFHHDWSRNKDYASFTFKFAPPVDGCYTLEEHHPGKSWLCSRYLPRNARLDIDYSKGNSSTVYINQAARGGQWNEIGTLPFYKGHEGRLTMRNSLTEQCEIQGNCFWVVDAFRLTWKGTDCLTHKKSEIMQIGDAVQQNRSEETVRQNRPEEAVQPNRSEEPVQQNVPEEPVQQNTSEEAVQQNESEETVQTSVPSMVPAIVPKETMQTEDLLRAEKGTEGVLLLRLNMADSGDTLIVQAKIQDEKTVLEATLASHFGYNTVSIVEAKFVVSGRRLHKEEHIALMKIRFIAHTKVIESTKKDLKQALQANLDIISPGIALDSANVEWSVAMPVDTEDAPKVTGWCLLTFYIVTGFIVLVVLGIAGIYCAPNFGAHDFEVELVREKLGDQAGIYCAHGMHEDLEKAKEVDDIEIASVSTGPPTSNDGTHSEESSLPGCVEYL